MERFAFRGRNICFIAAVLIFLFAVPLATWLLPNENISGIENRSLATVPVLEKETLVSGEYFSAWEDYFKDHIVARDAMILTNTRMQLYLLDRVEVNGIIPTKDVLLPVVAQPTVGKDYVSQAESMGERLSLLNDITKSYGGTFLYVGVPTQMTAYADEFPLGTFSGNSDRAEKVAAFAAALEKRDLTFLNMADVFERNGGIKQYYMRTDHHYSLKGAYVTYRSVCDYLQTVGYEIPVLSESDFNFTALDKRFWGSRNRAIYYLSDLDDPAYIAEPTTPIAFTRQNNGTEVAANVFQLPAATDPNVTYALYMGGDIAETVIRTNRENLPNVLIFGDSYTNALETLLYTSFNEMRSLDLRHYNKMTICEYIELYKPDIVICLRDDNSLLAADGNGDIR